MTMWKTCLLLIRKTRASLTLVVVLMPGPSWPSSSFIHARSVCFREPRDPDMCLAIAIGPHNTSRTVCSFAYVLNALVGGLA